MRIEAVPPEHLADAVELVTRRQADPDTHVGYLSTSADDISAALTELEPDGLAGVLVAVAADGVVGVLGAQHAADPPRVWWFGPFVADVARPDVVADALYEHARARLPAHVTQEEVACDERSSFLPSFARRFGFSPHEAASVLTRSLEPPLPERTPRTAFTVRMPTSAERESAAKLHEMLFPGAHSTGEHGLRDEPGRVSLVAVDEDGVLGYAVSEVEDEGSGYLDFVGVKPSARRKGVGAALVVSTCRALQSEHGCRSVNLTVLASLTAARRLYARLGFVEERVLQPWRKGDWPPRPAG